MAFAGRTPLQRQIRTVEKVKDRNFMHQCLIIPGGPFTIPPGFCVKLDDKTKPTSNTGLALPLTFMFVEPDTIW